MRRVVGWALRTRLEQLLALATLGMALTQRGAGGGLHHSEASTLIAELPLASTVRGRAAQSQLTQVSTKLAEVQPAHDGNAVTGEDEHLGMRRC